MLHAENKGAGALAIVGLGCVIATEVTIRACTDNPRLLAPGSWWLMSGYAVAAVYCLVLHRLIRLWEFRHGQTEPGTHSLCGIAVRYWSIVYLCLGVLRVCSPK